MTTASFSITGTEQVLPEMTLDFTTSTLDSRVTLTRSLATATCVNASGWVEIIAADAPRFDHNPLTLVCKGLLVEESRQNYFTYSEQFNDVIWIKSNCSIGPDAFVSPSGFVTADKLIESSSNSRHEMQRVTTGLTTASVYNYTIFAKAAERTAMVVFFSTGEVVNNAYAIFDLSNGTVYFSTGSTASISNYGNGFYRCSINCVTTGTTVTPFIGTLNALSTVRLNSYQGDGTSGIYVWGAQLEPGSFPTSYIPTTTSSLTRNADVATITGSNFTSFWNATQGGATVQATPSTVSGIRPLVQYDDGTANEIIALRGNTTNPELYIVDGGTPQAQLDAGTISANTAYSLTGWWATNDCRARKDLGAAVTDATATIPTVTQARIGSDGTNYLNGTIATINYYAAFSSQIYTRRKNKVFSSLF